MNREELAKLRKIHETKGLRLDTASGLSGTVYGSGGSETEPVTMLLDECARSFDKDAEITKLEEARELWRVIASVYEGKPDDYVVSVGHWYEAHEELPPLFCADVRLTAGQIRALLHGSTK